MTRIEGLLKDGKPVKAFEYNANRYRVARMLLEDVKAKDIALKLGISRKTVFFHKNGLKKELGMGPISTQGKYGKEMFKRGLISKGFTLYREEVVIDNSLPIGIR